ncbi:hypothetical protein QNN03_36195 [Streptomyces sp. GXMU-J15]|uniref:LigA protein n=1 Tax=Streptomyces fuscus TaxID=3048495 RepID=A0ABT7JC04_9ACTN|nr:hypothetical protein [Streptomyces fuscus]MDL2081882.1 hypothetical protein [Streptomyces fuscus]
MAGREFGHYLGLPGALSGLPLSPLVVGYGELAAAQSGAGLRHLGEALAPAGDLRVLDGLYVPSGPRSRRRVDADLLDDLARTTSSAAARVAELLAELYRRDPQGPRRAVLYQLICLLQESCPVEALGVHPDERAALVAAARTRPVLDRLQRDAAEALADAWERRRLHRVRGLMARLPQGDPRLERLRTVLAARSANAEAALAAARCAEEDGALESASERYLRALDLAADDKRALRGLVRVHRPGRKAKLRAEVALDHIALDWERDGTDWRLLCLYRTPRGEARVREVTGVRDTAVPLGTAVRYAAFPLADDRVAGPPLVSHRVLFAPEVTGLTLTDGPERIAGTWRRPPGAEEVTVEPVAGKRPELRADGFTVTGLPVGHHELRVVCHYRTPDGRLVPSPGVRASHRVHPWPEPVRTLTAVPEDHTVRFDWTGGAGAEVRLVVWPGRPPAPGTELRASELPPAVTVPPAGHSRVAAVSVLGERALAGPSVDVEVLQPVTGLGARRLPDGAVAVLLDWPAATNQLVVRWDGPDGTGERTVTAHAYRHGGLRLPVGPGRVRLCATAVPQGPRGAVVAAAGAETVVPPDTAIGYQLVRERRLLRGRGRTLLRVTLSSLGGGGGPDVPEFVCVARSGTVRPRSATDGTTVVRVPGAELIRYGTVEQELPAAPLPAPYTLRGFLLGEHAADVRLEEPSPATLVVR